MIKINLLPPEKRVPEKTPLPRFLLILSSAAAGAIIVFYVLFLFTRIATKNTDLTKLKKDRDALAKDVAIYTEESAKAEKSKSKIKEIDSVIERPVEWWRAIDAIWDEIHRHPKIWIDDIRVLDDRATQSALKKADPEAKTFPLYAIVIKCHASGLKVTELTRFRMALKRNETIRKALPNMNFNPDFKADEEKDYEEGVSLSFEIALFGEIKAPVKPPARVPAAQPKPK